MIRELTSYDASFIDRNINVPEFKRELKSKIHQNIERLKKDGLLDKEGNITDQGYEYSALSLLTEELDHLESKGLQGENTNKKRSPHGDFKEYKKYESQDKYKDISIKQTIKKAIKRGKTSITHEDFTSKTKNAKGKINILYCIDASGSMKGQKIKMAKRAGIALAHKATTNKDKAGLLVFNSEIETIIPPTQNFHELLLPISKITTKGETDIALAIQKANETLNQKKNNHIVLITDAVQTLGKKPQEEVLKKISQTTNQKITITIIGINLDKEGETLARKITDINNGKFYQIKSTQDLGTIVLEDYNQTRKT